MPHYETRFSTDVGGVGAFYRMLLVRSLREDRTILCVNDFIRQTETMEIDGMRLPGLGRAPSLLSTTRHIARAEPTNL